ncbi:MAG TPA: hypothetical protein VNE62_05640, partial [Actinomycetota bacterium]|nr:hypothetical protein [Actinomycetota bacterium]
AACNEIGKASQQVLYALVAYAYSGAVLDSFFHASFVSELQAVGPRLVQVYCRCPYEVARQRYEERARRDPTRHGDRERGEQDWQLWLKEGGRPLPLESPLLEVDTTLPVDADEVAQWVRDRSSREW